MIQTMNTPNTSGILTNVYIAKHLWKLTNVEYIPNHLLEVDKLRDIVNHKIRYETFCKKGHQALHSPLIYWFNTL
jgi:hypothetical protein